MSTKALHPLSIFAISLAPAPAFAKTRQLADITTVDPLGYECISGEYLEETDKFAAVAFTLYETITIASMPPPLAAFLSGATCSVGLNAVFRHEASLGGVGILALYLQEKNGFQAGWSQLIFDALLFGVAFFILPSSLIACSLAGALVTNTIVGFNHRQDRYIAR